MLTEIQANHYSMHDFTGCVMGSSVFSQCSAKTVSFLPVGNSELAL